MIRSTARSHACADNVAVGTLLVRLAHRTATEDVQGTAGAGAHRRRRCRRRSPDPGSVSAVLTGTKLAVTGTFEGLRSPATIAQLHKSPVEGVRGPVIFDLAVTSRAAPAARSAARSTCTPHSGRRPRKGPALRAAAQRESRRTAISGAGCCRRRTNDDSAACAAACSLAAGAGSPTRSAMALGRPASSRRPPSYTAAQAAAGRAAYQASCASCHLPDLAGRNEAPQLAGNNFMNTWRARTTRDLLRVHPVDDAADGREPQRRAVPRGHRVHPAGERRAGWRAAADADDRRARSGSWACAPATTTAGDPLPPAGRGGAGLRPVAGAPAGRGGRGGADAAGGRGGRRRTRARSASRSRAR